MQVHDRELPDVNRYIEKYRDLRLEDKEPQFESLMNEFRRHATIVAGARILEIGSGTGWFPVLCALRGIACKGIEISPQLVEFSRQLGRRYGVEPDVELGNIEEIDLGRARYDVIVANFVFEHVQAWEASLKKVYDALRPGGLLYFSSTNKFCFHTDEYPMPFYSWLPDSWRYRLRVARQGADIMKLGIDYNQFSYPQLRRFFKRLGFSRVMDLIEFRDPQGLVNRKPWRKAILRALKRVPPLRHAALFFSKATFFLCIK